MGAVHSSAQEMRGGLQDNGACVERGTHHIGDQILHAGNALGSGADRIADALHESALVGRDVATAHKSVGRSIPEAGVWVGGAGVCGSVWIAAGRNIALTRHATIVTGAYAVLASTVFGARAYSQYQEEQLKGINAIRIR